MKSKVIVSLLTIAGLITAAWQHWHIADLRGQEEQLIAEQERMVIGQMPDELRSQDTLGRGLGESEFADFSRKAESLRESLKGGPTAASVKLMDSLYHPLAKLSPAQIQTVIESWTEGQPVTEQFLEHSAQFMGFMFDCATENPIGTLQTLREKHWQTEEENRISRCAFSRWFQEDPGTLLQWLEASCQPTDFGGQASLWADAATVVGEPSEKNVRRFLSHPAHLQERLIGELLVKIPTSEGRVQFLQSLHAATGGICDDLLAVVTPLMKRQPFSKMAQLADAVPTIRASGKIVDSADPPLQAPLGSLRFELARASQDGTAEERWNWLVQREGDRPTDKALEKLAESWCAKNYFDTAAWAKSLPPGATHDSVAKGIVAFFESNMLAATTFQPAAAEKASALIKEWKTK